MLLHLLLFFYITAAGGEEVQHYRIVREGPDFIRYDKGSFLVPLRARLKVTSPGKVSVQGESRQSIAYTIKRRVRTRDVAAARRLLGEPELRISFRNHTSVDIAIQNGEDAVLTEVELRVPRRMAGTRLEVLNGGVVAYDLDSPLDVEAHAGSVTVDRIHAAVTANTGGGEIRVGKVDGSLRCKSGGGGITIQGAGADCSLETAGGEVCIREARGPVSARSGGGNVVVGRALSTVDVFTIGGFVEVTQALGMVFARTHNGAIDVGQAAGARCQSSSGAIRLNQITGPLQVYTQQGSIQAAIEGLKAGYSFLNTGAGDITVFLPSNMAVTVQAQTQAAGAIGNIFSEFPEIRMYGRFWLGSRPAQAEGALNGGGPTLNLSASGGIVNLKRQK